MTYNILIADDHSIVRSGIKALIHSNFSIERVDEASGEEEIVAQVKAYSFDLILLDINIPDMDFASLMNWLKVTTPKTYILVFSMHGEETYGRRSLQLGAHGYLHKTAPNEEIVVAIEKILRGDIYMSRTLRQILSQSNDEGENVNPF